MSLSITCLKQHEKENAIAKKWLLRGLLVAAGAHIGLIPLMALVPEEVAKPPERIELVVTGPTDPLEPIVEDVPLEEIPPEETVEALTEALAQAELADSTAISGGYSAPPPISSFQPPAPQTEVQPEPTAAEPDAFEPEPELAEPEPVAEASSEISTEPEIEPEAENSTSPDAEVVEAEEVEESDAEEGNSEDAEIADSDTDGESPDFDAQRVRHRLAHD